jgi:hypothetical protein
MSGRGVWAEKRPVAFCRARFSFTGVENGDLTFARDEVLLACPLSLTAFIHRNSSSGDAKGTREISAQTGSGGATASVVSNGAEERAKGVRWVLAIHPDGDCGRIPANYVAPLEDEEAKRLMALGTLGQLGTLFDELQREVSAETQRRPSKRRPSDHTKKEKHAKSTAGKSDRSGEVPTKAAAATTTTTLITPDPASDASVGSTDSQLQRFIQQKLQTIDDDDLSGTLAFYHNMRKGVQGLFDPPGSED